MYYIFPFASFLRLRSLLRRAAIIISPTVRSTLAFYDYEVQEHGCEAEQHSQASTLQS